MAIEDAESKILEYLKKEKHTNTFRLARELRIDRHKILNIIKKLEEKQAVEVKSGNVKFLKFPAKEKKVVKKLEVKKAPPKPKKKVKHKKTVLETTQTENKRLKEKILELQNLPAKIIRRTKIKKIIQKVPVKSKKLKEQAEYIKELEEKIKELQKKATHPKIIRRTIVKEIPKIIRKTIIKKVPIKIKKPEFIEQKVIKIRPKINFSKLNKNIKRLNVPEILKKS